MISFSQIVCMIIGWIIGTAIGSYIGDKIFEKRIEKQQQLSQQTGAEEDEDTSLPFHPYEFCNECGRQIKMPTLLEDGNIATEEEKTYVGIDPNTGEPFYICEECYKTLKPKFREQNIQAIVNSVLQLVESQDLAGEDMREIANRLLGELPQKETQ